MFTASGLIVRFLKVFEKSNYHSVKWVRYLTKASGSYQIRVRPIQLMCVLLHTDSALSSSEPTLDTFGLPAARACCNITSVLAAVLGLLSFRLIDYTPTFCRPSVRAASYFGCYRRSAPFDRFAPDRTFTVSTHRREKVSGVFLRRYLSCTVKAYGPSSWMISSSAHFTTRSEDSSTRSSWT